MKYGVAVDLGATNVRVAAGKRDGMLIAKLSERTNLLASADAVSLQVIAMIKRLQSEYGLNHEDMVGIGVGAFGPQDPVRGGIVNPANAPYDFIPVRKPLEEAFHVPVEVYNDCLTAVVGERFYGAGKGVDNLVYITISTGIGGGVYVDGHLLMGKDGNAHEVGHLVVDLEGRLVCGCGGRGHWEAYCSGRNIPNYVRLIVEEEGFNRFKRSILYRVSDGLDDVTASQVYRGAKAGDSFCMDVVNRVGFINALGIASVVNLYDPELITLGGAVTLNNRELVLNPIKRSFRDYIVNREPEITVTPLGGDVGLYGALALAFRLHKTC